MIIWYALKLNPAVSPHFVRSSPPRVPFVPFSRRVSLGRANLTVLRYQLPKMDLGLLHNHPQPGQQSNKKPANKKKYIKQTEYSILYILSKYTRRDVCWQDSIGFTLKVYS